MNEAIVKCDLLRYGIDDLSSIKKDRIVGELKEICNFVKENENVKIYDFEADLFDELFRDFFENYDDDKRHDRDVTWYEQFINNFSDNNEFVIGSEKSRQFLINNIREFIIKLEKL